MKIIVNCNTDIKITDELRCFGFEIINAPVNNNISSPVNTHPDMQLCIFDGVAVCDRHLYDFYSGIFKGTQITLFCGEKITSGNYPDDIAYNIKVVGNNVFHNFRYTDNILKNKLAGKQFIDVSQGYSGCSICKVSDEAIITSDQLIHKSAVKNGIKSLLISVGDIDLPPYDYGFIGGASFYFDKKVFFFGDISTHCDYKIINEFCLSCDCEIISLSGDKLFDYGSALIFE